MSAFVPSLDPQTKRMELSNGKPGAIFQDGPDNCKIEVCNICRTDFCTL